jgi:hypothetical protein
MKPMKKLVYITAVIVGALFFSSRSFASGPENITNAATSKVLTPVSKTLHDCDITYYIIKINNENVLMDNKGKVIKYLCEDDKLMKPERYQVLNIPTYLLIR